MHKKLKIRRILSVVLTATMLATALPETGISVDAAESGVVDSMAVVNQIGDENDGDVSTGDVSDGNLLPGEEPTEPDEPGVTEEPGDVSSGNIGFETVSNGNEGQEENNTMPESAEILASGISRGCSWTLDTDGNLVVRDNDGEYGTDDWGWKTHKEEIKTVDMDISFADSVASMFYGCTAMESAKIKIDKSEGSAAYMFGGCYNLVQLDINGFNTGGINNMSGMFAECSELKELDLSHFNTENVTSMYRMFFCYDEGDNINGIVAKGSKLKKINLSSFRTLNVTNMNGMFAGCRNLETLDISSFNTQNVTNMDSMFRGCSSLEVLDVSNLNTGNVKYMSSMFYECNRITNLDLSNFDTQNVTYMAHMFQDCNSLTTLDLSNFDTQKVTSMSNMFMGCKSLTALDLSNFKTQNVTTMFCMFAWCTNLVTLNISNFNTQNVTDMTLMFQYCSKLKDLDVSSFDTHNVTYMSYMFLGCNALTTLDVSGFDTHNVCYMQDMFGGCYSLTILDVSNFNTENVTNMQDMFAGCGSLTVLDVSSFNTENVTNMSEMFYGCGSLESLDVSKFDTKNVVNMEFMFGYCNSLKNLNVSNFETQNVTDMGAMFKNCNSLTTLNVTGFDTKNVTNMGSMFYGCSSLETLDLSNFDTRNVTYMSGICDDCTNLKSIKTFPNLQLSVALPATMYDKGGKSYTEFPKGLSEGIWLARDVKDIPKELSFEKVHYELREGQTCQLKLENLPAGVAASQFSFSSSNPEVVTVDAAGLATAVSVGTAKVEASYGEYKATCYIMVIEKGFYVEEIKDVIYTGSAVKPEVVVYDNDSILTEGVDYTLAYANNTAAADKSSTKAPKVTVTGKGNYSGKVVATFTILPYDIEEGGVMVSLPRSVLVANNKVQKPVPVVTFNGKKLAANKDYTVSYPQLAEEGAYKNPGTYDVQVTFKNNFTGTKMVKVEIKEGTPVSKVKVGTIAKQPYTGSAIEPRPVITMGTKTLVEGTDYTLTYGNNILPGKATVKITGLGEYVGERTLTFEITGTSLSKAQVTGITDKTYNGKIQLQDLKVSLDNGTTFLTEGVDYKVVYEKNLNVGTARVKIVGAGGYVGTINKSFRILPYNLTTDVDNALSGIPENLVVSYIKGGCNPELTLMFHEYRMDQKKECTISYTNNTKLGNASDTKAPTITIKGKGNFTGTITIPFTIVSNDLSAEDTSVKLTVADVAYVNKAGKYISTPVLLDSNGKKLAAGTDYEKTIVYTMGGKVLDPKKDIVPVGSEVTVTVTGKGFYTGTISATYRITEKTFTSAKITVNKQTYTGKPIQLTAEDIKVVIGKDTLVYGVDFEVVEDSYLNNVAKGTASVTIKGKGKYGGMKNVKFAIVPKGIN